MKYVFLFIAIVFSISKGFSQVEKKISIYYGANYFMPSNGYAHGVGLQKNIIKNRLGNINGEVSFLIGGPYSFNFFTGQEVGNLEAPYKVLHATVGANFETRLSKSEKNKLSFGILGGYSRYEIPVTIQNSQGNGGSVQGYFKPRNRPLIGASIRYIQKITINNFDFYLIPNYNVYKTSIFTSSAGILLSIEL